MSFAIENEAGIEAGGIDPDCDYALCACDLESLRQQVQLLEELYRVEILQAPSVCLTMVKAEDSLEKQPFYLGEALCTEAEVRVDGECGYGLCMGDEPVRAYCIAVIDALLHNGHAVPEDLNAFLRAQEAEVARRDQQEHDLVLQTQVDFKLMEEA